MYFTPLMASSMSLVTLFSSNLPRRTPDTSIVLVSKSSRMPPWNWGISNMFTAKPREARSPAMACAPWPAPRMATASFTNLPPCESRDLALLRGDVRRRQPTVHQERGSVHIAGLVAGEEQGRVGDLPGTAQPAHRQVDTAALVGRGVVAEHLHQQRGLDGARA